MFKSLLLPLLMLVSVIVSANAFAMSSISSFFATRDITVNTIVSPGGSLDVRSATVSRGETATFTVTPNAGYNIRRVSGCRGTLSGNKYTTGPIKRRCIVRVNFRASFVVSTDSTRGGSISPANATVTQGRVTRFTLTPTPGFNIDQVTGCSGKLLGNTYTTGRIHSNCTINASFSDRIGSAPPVNAAKPDLSFEQIKNFRFSWRDVADATHYKLLENPDGASGFTQVGKNIKQGIQSVNRIVSLPKRVNAQYILQSCNAAGCTDSANLSVSGTLVGSIGSLTASNASNRDRFGDAVAISGNGRTLVVGAYGESSNATSVNGNQADNSKRGKGAAYVFTLQGNRWQQQAYLKASSAGSHLFGLSVVLSRNGNTLAVSAINDSSNAKGINGNQNNNAANRSGAVYLFTRTHGTWRQNAYVKASNTQAGDMFGYDLALSADGRTLAVGAYREDSKAVRVNGNQRNNSASNSGAVYVFSRNKHRGTWSQQAYLKASNTRAGDQFGMSLSLSDSGNTLAVGARERASSTGAVYLFTRTNSSWHHQSYLLGSNTERRDYFGAAVSLSGDGNTLAVGAILESSSAVGVNGNQSNNIIASASGAVYVFTYTGSTWNQQAYIKASNTKASDMFGHQVALSSDGNTLAITAIRENSNAVGIGGNQNSSELWGPGKGAAYLFARKSGTWKQQAYIKAGKKQNGGGFGESLSLSDDGNTLVVGSPKSETIYLY